MKQLLLIGAGGHCKVFIEQVGEWQIAGNSKESVSTEVSSVWFCV